VKWSGVNTITTALITGDSTQIVSGGMITLTPLLHHFGRL